MAYRFRVKGLELSLKPFGWSVEGSWERVGSAVGMDGRVSDLRNREGLSSGMVSGVGHKSMSNPWHKHPCAAISVQFEAMATTEQPIVGKNKVVSPDISLRIKLCIWLIAWVS